MTGRRWGIGRFLLPLFFYTVFPAPVVRAQEAEAVAVRDALRDRDQNHVPLQLGKTVTLVGVLTSDPYLANDRTESRTYLQDSTAGIRLLTLDHGLFRGLERGDVVRVLGKVGHHNGMELLEVDEIRRLGTGEVPRPRHVQVADLLSEQYSGQLVRVAAHVVVPADLQVDLSNLKLVDESGEIRLYIRNVLFRDPAFTARLLRGGRLEVVGIAEQYDNRPPFSSGYRLLPRDGSDFRFPLIIPFKAIAISTIITALLAMMCHLVLRRRTAERRERETALLLQRITRAEDRRQQTEEALRLSAEIADNMAEGVCLTRVEDGQIVYANRRFEQMFGYGQGETLGKHCSFVNAPGTKTPERVAEEIIGSVKKTGSWHGDVKSVKKDGIPFWCRVTVSTFEHARYGTTGVFVYGDITERRRMEEEIRRHSDELEELVDERTSRVLQLEQHRSKIEQLASTGQVAAAVAHEINNPLAGIKNAFLLIKGAIPADHPRVLYVGLIERELNRITSIVRQMYQLYRPESHKAVRFDMGVVVAEVCAMLEGTIKEHDLILKSEIPPDLPHVRLPETEVRQVLYNLIKNAVHASPNGAELVVRVAHDGGSIRVGVTDRGEGIPPNVLPHIMEPFFTTQQGNSDSGMGLGLSVSHTLVRAMRGSIEVETQTGQGTTMTMVLPCQQVMEKAS